MRSGGCLVGAVLVVLMLCCAASAEAESEAGSVGPWVGLFALDVLGMPVVGGAERQDLDSAALANPPGLATLRELGSGAAGGEAVAHRAGARPAEAAGPVAHAQRSATGYSAAEPSLGIAPDGTVFYDGEVRTPLGVAASALLRSRDQGATWQQLDPLGRGARDDSLTLDPFLYVDPVTGWIFHNDFLPPCSPVSTSRDGGATFAVSRVCSHTDHQNLFAGPAPPGGQAAVGSEHVVYYCAVDGGASVVALFTACSKSLTGGATWRRTGAPAYPGFGPRSGGSLGIPGYCYGATGHGRVDHDGVVYLPRGWCGQPYLSISRDEGATWTRVQVAASGMNTGIAAGVGLEDHEARVAIDADGNVYYMWIARDRLPYVAISRDGATTFGAPMMIAAPGVNETWGPSIDVGDPGHIAFSYMGTTNSPGPPYCTRTTPLGCTTAGGGAPKPAAAYAGTTWNGYIGLSTDALDADPRFQTATVNPASDPLVRGVCGPVQCQQEVDFLTLQIAPDGTPWASFVDGCTADPSAPCLSPGAGIAGRLVGGPKLIGATATARPPRSCTPARRVVLRIRAPRGTRLRTVRVRVNGHPVRARRANGHFTAVIDLRGHRGRIVVVRARATGRSGRTLTTTRRYRVCAS